MTETDAQPALAYRIPNDSDFLIAYSTVFGWFYVFFI
jgi:hypothetical protein